MKKILFLIALFISVNASFAAFTVPSAEKPPVETKAQKERAMMEMVVKMSVKDYEVMTGKKMNFFERLAFKAEKKRFEKQLKRAEATSEGFNIGGFLLGFLLGLLGVLLAYIFSHDSNLRKWSWIGLGAAVVVALILIAAG